MSFCYYSLRDQEFKSLFSSIKIDFINDLFIAMNTVSIGNNCLLL